MTIAARSGVSGVRISKIHAAYSLGASKWQILKNVIIPNSLPDIFTGARVAMGVCWGTVVAAELVAADKGAGMMIVNASKFQLTDIVILGIILIGIIGYGIDILMRMGENWLYPGRARVDYLTNVEKLQAGLPARLFFLEAGSNSRLPIDSTSA